MPSKDSINIADRTGNSDDVAQQDSKALLARAASGIAESFPGLGNEFPVVAFGMQGKLQNSVGIGIAQFAGSYRRCKRAVTLASGAHYEFSYAVRKIEFPVRILRCETFVVVVVAVQYQSRVRGVQILPKRLHLWIISMFRAGTEKRLVSVSQRAYMWVRLQVRAQPFFFHRTSLAATDLRALAVQHDDMPRTEFVAVIALARVAGICAEIIEIRCGAAEMKLVVAD